MTARPARWIGPAIAAGCVVAQVMALALLVASEADWDAATLVLLAFPVVGAVIVTRRPGNAIGWILTLGGATTSFGVLCAAVVNASLDIGADPTRSQEILAWIANLTFINGFELMLLALALLYPTGRFLSSGWRVAGVSVLVLDQLAALSDLLNPGPLGGLFSAESRLDNPLGVAAVGTLRSHLGAIGWVTAVALILTALAAVVMRARRSRGIERLQIRWLALAFGVTAFGAMLSGLGNAFLPGEYQWLARAADSIFFLAATVGTSTAIGVAILRYRLYEIDRLVNRTLVYLALSASLLLIYVALVLLLGGLTRSLTGERSGLVTAVSTLIAAALFRPLRGRIQAFVDRSFYRRKYDATRLVAAFAATMSHEFDLETLDAELRRVVQETVQPAHVSLWLRPDRRR